MIRETKLMQENIEEQIDQIAYELTTARDSFKVLKDYIQEKALESPTRNELRRTAAHCQHILDDLSDLLQNAPRS